MLKYGVPSLPSTWVVSLWLGVKNPRKGTNSNKGARLGTIFAWRPASGRARQKVLRQEIKGTCG